MDLAAYPNNSTNTNRIYEEDRSIHDWYRFVLSFPPHLVRTYIDKFKITDQQCILDPFSGTGTTLVESKKCGIKSIGVEANPIVHMVSETKIEWNIDIDKFIKNAQHIASHAEKNIKNHKGKLKSLEKDAEKLLINNSISPIPLHKSMILLESIFEIGDILFLNLYKTAFAKQLILNYSNLHFFPEVGVSKKKKEDCLVTDNWLTQIEEMYLDLIKHKSNTKIYSKAYYGDSRNLKNIIPEKSIDAVICSPPYPNEKDYTRTTRLESVLLNFIRNKYELREHKESLIRSNTRNVFKGDCDESWISENTSVQRLANNIEQERIRLKKTSGFEKLYHKVVKLYFGGMAKHLEGLKPALKEGASLAYVVGDQASYFRIPIRTGAILEEIAYNLGYEVIGRDLFRMRFATATKEQLREEVVLLRWNK
jgi:DNA modification methylase